MLKSRYPAQLTKTWEKYMEYKRKDHFQPVISKFINFCRNRTSFNLVLQIWRWQFTIISSLAKTSMDVHFFENLQKRNRQIWAYYTWMDSVMIWDDVHVHLKSNGVFIWTVLFKTHMILVKTRKTRDFSHFWHFRHVFWKLKDFLF